MKTVDKGHVYQLQVLDQGEPPHVEQLLVFVKRQGEKYPGNQDAYPGTILQEVLRASTDRLRYVIAQGRHLGCIETESEHALQLLETALWLLEARAARLHGKPTPTVHAAEFDEPCWKCGHVVCADDCEGRRAA